MLNSYWLLWHYKIGYNILWLSILRHWLVRSLRFKWQRHKNLIILLSVLKSCDQLDFIIVLQPWWVGLRGSVDTPIRMGAKFLLCPCPTPSFVLLVSVWVPYLSSAYGTVPIFVWMGPKFTKYKMGMGNLCTVYRERIWWGILLLQNSSFFFIFFYYSFSFYL